MDYERYEFVRGSNEFEYEFYSVGPKGRIRKKVHFTRLSPNSISFNLSFGDWNEELKKKNDAAKSNNGDRDKVLATVAAITIDFIMNHSNCEIIAFGGTISRVRLYQMGITRVIDKVDPKFVIKGYLEDEWEVFQKGLKYEAFLLTIKSN